MNPGQSVKDRAALFIIEDAVKSGRLRRGGVIVEGTAGNTGIGLALVGNALGFRSVIVIPETQSQEKKDMLRLCGAELVEVPAVPYANPNNYVKAVRPACRRAGRRPSRMARSGRTSSTMSPTATAISQPPAPKSGTRPTARSTDSSASVGTGGTLAGIGIALKERNKPDQDRARRPDGRGALQLLHHRRAQIRGLLDHRRHRARPHHQESRRRAGRHRLPDSRRRSGADHLRPARARGPVPRRLDRASTSPARSASPASSGRATPSSPCCATTARATRRSCSIRNSCAPRDLPVPEWLERHSSVTVPFVAA